MIRNFIILISIFLLISNVYTESIESTEVVSKNNGFLQEKPIVSLDINKIIKCGSAITSVASKAPPIIQDLMSHTENIFIDVMKLLPFYQELVDGCNGVFNVQILNKIAQKIYQNNFLALSTKVGKMPAIGDIINCIKAIKPLATDIYNAVTLYQKGDTKNALNALEQASVDALSMGFSCWKVISDIISD